VPVKPEEIKHLLPWLARARGALEEFWEVAQLEKLYEEFSPQCIAGAGLDRARLAALIARGFSYMEINPPDKQLVIIPNMLQDSFSADFVQTKKTDYLIEGHSPIRPNSICHELCHPVVEKMLLENADLVAESEPLLSHVEEPMREMGLWLADRSSTWRWVLAENLVRAVCDRVTQTDSVFEAVRDDIDHGFAFVAYAAGALEKLHEKEGQSFAFAVSAFLEHLVHFANSRAYIRQA
jgi:hypothetical protein